MKANFFFSVKNHFNSVMANYHAKMLQKYISDGTETLKSLKANNYIKKQVKLSEEQLNAKENEAMNTLITYHYQQEEIRKEQELSNKKIKRNGGRKEEKYEYVKYPMFIN